MADSSSPSQHGLPAWMSVAPKVDFKERPGDPSSLSPSSLPSVPQPRAATDYNMGLRGAGSLRRRCAVLSAVLVNPLDVAKTRLQAQAAGVPCHHPTQHHFGRQMFSLCPNMMLSNFRCSPSCGRAGIFGAELVCPPDCFEYKGTLDVFYKVVRQEGFTRLWRGTNAGLALAVPTVGIYLPCYDIFRNWIEQFTSVNAPTLTPYAPLVAGSVARSLACITCSPIELARTRMQAYKEFSKGAKPPGMWKTLVGVLTSLRNTSNQNMQGYRILWTGVGAQLARDVPFSAICWSTLEPIRRRLLLIVDEEGNAARVVGANFSAGFVARSLAAAATCPLDNVKTRRQIEVEGSSKGTKYDHKADVGGGLEDGRHKASVTGVGPRVARAGPSVGIVVSFYEVVKYVLHQNSEDL